MNNANGKNVMDMSNPIYAADERMPICLRDVDKTEYPYECDICHRPLKKPIRAYGVTYCHKHWRQKKKYGAPIDDNPRTTMDPNDIRIDGDTAYVDLYDSQCSVVATAVIDAEDVPKIMYDKWRYSHGYACYATKKKGSMMMHRKILGVDSFVDHINHDTIFNKKCNLRPCDKSTNSMNSEHKGVTNMNDGRYYAHIKINGKMINLGLYEFEQEALFARWYAETCLFKEFQYPREEPDIPEQRKSEIMTYVDRKVQRL